jgi:hypothetical protein
MTKKFLLLAFLILAVLVAGCAQPEDDKPRPDKELSETVADVGGLSEEEQKQLYYNLFEWQEEHSAEYEEAVEAFKEQYNLTHAEIGEIILNGIGMDWDTPSESPVEAPAESIQTPLRAEDIMLSEYDLPDGFETIRVLYTTELNRPTIAPDSERYTEYMGVFYHETEPIMVSAYIIKVKNATTGKMDNLKELVLEETYKGEDVPLQSDPAVGQIGEWTFAYSEQMPFESMIKLLEEDDERRELWQGDEATQQMIFFMKLDFFVGLVYVEGGEQTFEDTAAVDYAKIIEARISK